jgi:hypothetical protein
VPSDTLPPGCYIDSHHGHYAIPRVIQLAESLGRQLDEHIASLLKRYDAHSHEPEYPMEVLIDESDAAIDWLNEHRALDGHSWGWNDGDFGLYPLEQED